MHLHHVFRLIVRVATCGRDRVLLHVEQALPHVLRVHVAGDGVRPAPTQLLFDGHERAMHVLRALVLILQLGAPALIPFIDVCRIMTLREAGVGCEIAPLTV